MNNNNIKIPNKDCKNPWKNTSVYNKLFLSKTGIKLQIKVTKISFWAPLFLIKLKGLTNKSLIFKDLLKSTNEPKKIINIPKYWCSVKFSSNIILENRRENKGE